VTVAWRILEVDRSAAPPEWREARIGELVDLVNGFPFDSATFDTTGALPLVRIRDLGTDPMETWVPEPVPPAVVLRNGDLVVGMDGDFNVAWWSKGPAALNQRLCRLRARQGKAVQRYLYYALPRVLKVINDLTYYTTVKHLASGDLLSEKVLLPSVEEQQRIADYLDYETARIDELIAEHRLHFDLLEERFRALLVTTLVRRSPDESRRPTRLKFLFEYERNGYWGEEAKGDSNDVLCVRVADFDRRTFTAGPNATTIRNVLPTQRLPRLLQRGDVLLEKSGGTDDKPVGCAVSYDGDEPAICSNFIATLRPSDAVDLRWAALLLAAHYSARLNAPFVKQTIGIQNLDSASYLGLRVWVPSIAAQRKEADRLDAYRRHISATQDEVNTQVRLLQEHRQALVTHAVTHGIDGLPGVA